MTKNIFSLFFFIERNRDEKKRKKTQKNKFGWRRKGSEHPAGTFFLKKIAPAGRKKEIP